MPRPFTLRYGPFIKGLVTAIDAELVGEKGFTTAEGLDISKGTLAGMYGVGTAVTTGLDASPRFVHYAADDTWIHSTSLQWAFDDAGATVNNQRVTYRTNNPTGYPTATVGATTYRLGIDTPGGSPAVSGGSGAGACAYAITFYCPDTGVESNPKTLSGTATGANGASLTAIPAFPTYPAIADPARTNVKVRIYRTEEGDASGTKYYLAEIAAVYAGTTSFTDNTGSYAINTTIPLEWGDGGSLDNDAMPYDHRPPLLLTVLPNAMHSVNEGASGLASGIIIAGMGNWLVWSRLGYPHYWPAVNQMQLNERVTAIHTMGAQTFVFTENEIYSVSGVADYALSIVKTQAPYGVRQVHGKTVANTPLGLVFWGRDGLVAFDGVNLRPLSAAVLDPYPYRLASETGSDFACGAYYQGHYFLSFDEGETLIFDLSDPGNITLTTSTVWASSFYLSTTTIGSTKPGLFVATTYGNVHPWRPRDKALVTGAQRFWWEARTGEATADAALSPKRFTRARIQGAGTFTVKFCLDGSTTPILTLTASGQHWLPTTAYGRTLALEIASSNGTGEIEAIEVDGEVLHGY